MQDDYLALTVGAILVNNFVLSKFLGICPFLGVSKKLATALGMSGAVIFVMTLASMVAALVNNFVLAVKIGDWPVVGAMLPPEAGSWDLLFLQTLVFIVVIAALVQVVELAMQKAAPALYQALGIYLPLITTNCAVLGVAVINAGVARGVIASTLYGFCSAAGFSLALLIFSSIRERVELADVPRPLRGTSIALVTAGMLAMGFMGFAGLVR